MIKTENGTRTYFDKNGTEITDGCVIRYEDGRTEKVYKTENNELGIDATNKKWIASGRACECEYGIYPLNKADTDEVEVVQ